jgi:hypothetical protein
MAKSPKVAKHPREMTTEEAVSHLFHPKVIQHLKNVKDGAKQPPLKKG